MGRRHPPRLELLHDDAHFVALQKPAGLATISERWDPEAATVIDELWRAWREEDADAPRPHVVHRLDRDTTGVLLFARHRAAQAELRRQFRERTTDKSYRAIVCGCPASARGTIEFQLREDERRPGRMRTVRKGGKECATEYVVLEEFREHSLVELHPLQGRTHQVRIALRELGQPCVADAVYGDGQPILLSTFKRGYRTGRGREERPLIARVALHAARLAIRHPETGAPLAIEAPDPPDFAHTLRQLRRWAPAPGAR